MANPGDGQGWIWACSERTIPIPGFKNTAQVKEYAGAMEFGALTEEQMKEIENLLKQQEEKEM